MARDLTIAVVQMQPKLGQLEENLVKMAEWVTTVAARQRVDLIVFPELITSGAELGPPRCGSACSASARGAGCPSG